MKDLSYPFTIRPLSKAEGGGYCIEFPDLLGCISDGETPEQAIANGKEAAKEWLHACKKLGRPIPKPTIAAENNYSGKVLQRFPRTLHARLAQQAKREGVSLNQLILSMVSEALGHRA